MNYGQRDLEDIHFLYDQIEGKEVNTSRQDLAHWKSKALPTLAFKQQKSWKLTLRRPPFPKKVLNQLLICTQSNQIIFWFQQWFLVYLHKKVPYLHWKCQVSYSIYSSVQASAQVSDVCWTTVLRYCHRRKVSTFRPGKKPLQVRQTVTWRQVKFKAQACWPGGDWWCPILLAVYCYHVPAPTPTCRSFPLPTHT